MAPSGAPQKSTNMAAVDRGARPIDRPGRVELAQQLLMQAIPHAGLLPVAQAPPTRHTRPVAVLLRQILPRDPGVQHVQDPIERETIGDRLATRIAMAALTDRDQRLDLRPQRVIDLETRRHLQHLRQLTTRAGRLRRSGYITLHSERPPSSMRGPLAVSANDTP